MGTLWASWNDSKLPRGSVREQRLQDPDVRPIGATLSYAYGDAGFNPSTHHLTFPLPPATYRSRPIAAVPLALIDHSEVEYDELIEAEDYGTIRQSRTIFVIANVPRTPVRNEGGWQFSPWADLLIDGEECRLRSYDFRPLRSDGPVERASDPRTYSHGLAGYGRDGPIHVWPKIFLPDRTLRPASIQFRDRDKEIANVENLLLWAVTRGLGLRSTLIVQDAVYAFDHDGVPGEADGLPVKVTIKPANYPDWLTGEIRGPEFHYVFLFELFGRDMNVGVQGVFVRSRLTAQGDRAALRTFLENAAAKRPQLKLPIPVRLPVPPKRRR